jgi:hypothetical protein
MNFQYNAPPTISRFMQCEAFGRFISGPIGSGKTTGVIMEILRRSALQRPATDGLRRTRWAVVRNTMQQLRTTILPDIQSILSPIVRFYTTESTIQIRAGDIHADLLLMPLDTPDDKRRLLSTQLTGAWLSEFREIDFSLLTNIAGRCGRYPNKIIVPPVEAEGFEGGPTWFGVIGETNSFSEGSDWHRFLVLERPSEYEFFRQPSGLSPQAENVENLVKGYYTRLAEGQSEDWVKVYIENEFGVDLSGQSVFRASFNFDRHVTDNELYINPLRPILIAMDFGRTPTAVLMQVSTEGRLQIFDELLSVDMGLEQFLTQKLTPLLHSEKYSGREFYVVGDPAGIQRSQVNEMSCFDVLKSAGYRAYPANTNDVGARVRAVETLLLQNRGSGPALLIHGPSCPNLVKALRHDYRYKRQKSGMLTPDPEKNEASHIADALQYGCLAVAVDLPGKIMARRNVVRRPGLPAAAWC